MRLACALALAALSSCRPAGPPSAAGWELTEYSAPDGSFRCLAPARWKVREDAGAVMFFGPDRVSIAVARYPEGRVKTEGDYAASLRGAGPLESASVGGKTVGRLHALEAVRPPNSPRVLYEKRLDAALVPAGAGFYAVEHRAPADRYERTLPVFEAVVASLAAGGR